MRIEQKNTSKTRRLRKALLFAVIIIILAVAGLATYVYAFNGSILGWSAKKSDDSSTKSDEPTEDQKKAGEKIKESTIKGGETEGKPTTEGSDQPQTPTPIEGSNKKNVEVIITAAAQNGSTLQIRTLISAVTGSGTCTLSLSRSSTPELIVQSAVIPSSSSSSCQGFDVPVSQLASGTWKATITFNNDELTGSTSRTVDVKK